MKNLLPALALLVSPLLAIAADDAFPNYEKEMRLLRVGKTEVSLIFEEKIDPNGRARIEETLKRVASLIGEAAHPDSLYVHLTAREFYFNYRDQHIELAPALLAAGTEKEVPYSQGPEAIAIHELAHAYFDEAMRNAIPAYRERSDRSRRIYRLRQDADYLDRFTAEHADEPAQIRMNELRQEFSALLKARPASDESIRILASPLTELFADAVSVILLERADAISSAIAALGTSSSAEATEARDFNGAVTFERLSAVTQYEYYLGVRQSLGKFALKRSENEKRALIASLLKAMQTELTEILKEGQLPADLPGIISRNERLLSRIPQTTLK